MRYIKINPKAVSALRDKTRLTQQELAAHVGCSLSAVQFWEAGRSSPRGYRLRRLMELCPDEASRAMFFAHAAAETKPTFESPVATVPLQVEWEKRYLDPGFLRSLPAETRTLYCETVEKILRLNALKGEGNQVAAEGLHSLAEAINQIAGLTADTTSGRGGPLKAPSSGHATKGHVK